MTGHAADGELAGGEAGLGLGAQPPPGKFTFADDGIGARTADSVSGTGCSGDPGAAAFGIPDYSVDNGDRVNGTRAYDGFGRLLARGDEPPGDPLPSPVDDFGDEAAMVRPYAWTRGRTRANYDLKLETLVSTTELGEDGTLLPQLEHRVVSDLCRYPLSVAEVAAKLSIPLGVARVILSDMAELGLISIHRTFADDDIAAHLVLMERVLSGLRRL